MAWCPLCGRWWIVRTGVHVHRGVLGRSDAEVPDPPDLICPECEPHVAA